MKILILLALLALASPAGAQTPTPAEWAAINTLIAPTHAPLKPWTHLVIASSMVAHMADLSTTSWAMGKGGYREANPVLKPFAGDPVALALAKGSLAVGVNYYLLRLHERKPKTVLVIGIVQTLAVGYVAHRNAALVRGQ